MVVDDRDAGGCQRNDALQHLRNGQPGLFGGDPPIAFSEPRHHGTTDNKAEHQRR